MTLEFIDVLNYNGTNPQTFSQLSSSTWSAISYSPAITAALGLTLILLTTRILTSQQTTHDGPPTVPYWFPFLGHIPNMLIDAENFMRKLRDTYTGGGFAVNFAGTRHNIFYTPALATALFNQPRAHLDFDSVGKHLTIAVFGFPKREIEAYDRAVDDVHSLYKLLISESSLGQLVAQTGQKIRENVVNLVSFNRSPVDQTPWEKTSSVELKKTPRGEEIVEASLLPLIRDFCAFSAGSALFGSDFLENYPESFDDMWIMDNAFLLLATGLPRWVPIPLLTRGHIARQRNLQRLDEFHEAMEKWSKGEDPGPKWSSLEDVGALIKARIPVYQKYNLSIRARSAIEIGLMWAANANSNTLVFWIVNRVYEDRTLLAMLREEIAPYVHVEHSASSLPISEPPHITHFDVEALCSKCPLLKSVYVECLRLDSASTSVKVVQQDFTLQSREKGARTWLLRKGDIVQAAHDLHNTDPSYFEDPMVFKADRHIKTDEKEGKSADLGSIRPYGGGTSMCKGRALAFKDTMMFTAAIVSMWDIEPAGGGPWKMPRHKKATGVYNTSDETRVFVKRRKFASVSET